ncbi:MAG: glycosyltransferase [Candidatus Omnitrophica bacterium]|nr:glycosyltransferase [Candidatus Omnitrophota bacterium]
MSARQQPNVTVVVVPRERFSLTRACVERLYTHTPEPFQLLVVDANAPRPIARWLRQWEASHANCRVIRSERFLYPYEAKNLVLPHLATPWVAFLDSDVLVGPQWLTWLRRAADETGARVVHPLYFVEQEDEIRIHMTDGKFRAVQRNGQSLVHPVMGHVAQRVEAAQGLQRQDSDFLEFHGFFIHQEVLRRVGPFEPFTLGEDVNFSFRLRDLRERIVFEPRSVITYVAGPPFERADLPYFRFRWDLEQGKASVERLRERWPLPEEYCRGKLSWATYHHSRAVPWFSLVKRWRRWLGQAQSALVAQLRRMVPVLRSAGR